MTLGVRQEIDRLLKEANDIMMEVNHIQATKEEKDNAKAACHKLYTQIKLLDRYTYNLVTATIDDD
tara:strand:- start:2183 stop:2380 length:198 start_codon:yes stop_codon:yes gene_type:complete